MGIDTQALGVGDGIAARGPVEAVDPDDASFERDRSLVLRSQAGEADAFGELYVIYHARLVRHCARRLGGRAGAEDVAQEAFIRAWRAMDRFDVRRRFYPWLHVIASNACTDVLRRQRPTAPLTAISGTAERDDGCGVEELFTRSVDAELATDALRQLTDRHRRVLHLREGLEWSVEDIASHEGLEANAVDTLLWRARASLRRKFHELSDGAAAMVAIGGVRFALVRRRLVHVAHQAHGAIGPAARVPAALAVAIVIGVGAASLPSTPEPATHGTPAAGAGQGTVTVPDAHRGGAGVVDGRARSGGAVAVARGGTHPLTPTPAVPPITGPVSSTSATGPLGAPVASAASGSGATSLPVPPVTTGGLTGAGTVTGVLTTAGGVARAGAAAAGGVVGVVAGAAATVTGGAVQAPVVTPVPVPGLLPAAGSTGSGVTGVLSTIGGLTGH